MGAGLAIASVGGLASRCESIPATRGWLDEVRGGFNAIKKTDVKGTDHVCPSTLKN